MGFRVGQQITDDLNPTTHIGYVLDLTKQYHNLLQITDNERTKNYAWDFNVVSESSGDGERYYLQDQLGSPLRFTGADGALVDSYGYDEFGNDLYGNQGLTQPFGYTGYRYDNVAQTYFAQAREYDPAAGRFTARDVFKGYIAWPATLNEYSYCINSPEIYVDLDGEFFTLITATIGAVAGAIIGGAASAITQISSGKSFDELDWGDIGKSALTGAAIGGVTGLTLGAAAAVLPAAGAAVGIGAGMTFGLSASTVATVTTVATVAGGVAIGSCGLFAASSIVEQGTSGYYSQIPGSSGNSYNPVRDSVFGGNQGLYDTMYMASSFATLGVMQLGVSNIGLKPPSKSSDNGLNNPSYAQNDYRQNFSAKGQEKYSELAGQPIKTVDDLSNALKNGTIKPSDIKIDYIVRHENTLILNTRTSQALIQAGIPMDQWSTVNRTGNAMFENMLTNQLTRNELTCMGTSTVTPK